MKNSKIALAVFLCLGIIVISSGQTRRQPLRHEVQVSVINVPVYVTDKQGNPVLDLTADDFIIQEGGKERPLTHFALIRNDSPEVLDLLNQYPSARRHFFILFDLSFTTFKGLLRAREAARNFVTRQTVSLDLVGVGTFSIFQGLRIICPFTADREQSLLAIDTLGLTKLSQRVKDPMGFVFKPYQDITAAQKDTKTEEKPGDAEIAEQVDLMMKGMRRLNTESLKSYVSGFISSFEILARALNIVAGRKNLLYFSEGFDSSILGGPSLQDVERDTEALLNSELWKIDTDLGGSAGLRTALFETLRRFTGSDCAIHTVDVGGLRSESQVDSVSGTSTSPSVLRSGQDTLNLLSNETGGYAFRNTNDLGQTLDFILRATNSYYLLGYAPEKKTSPGKFVSIKVQVKKPDLQVSHRKGFFGEKPYRDYSDLEKQLQLAEYISKDMFSNDVDFRLLTSSFRGTERIAQIPVFLEMPGSQFPAGSQKGKETKVEFYGYAINGAGGFVDYFHQTLTLDLRKLGERFQRRGIKYYDLFLVRPGDTYKIKVIVRNSQTGEIGCRIEEVAVPEYAEERLSLSTPVVLDADDIWILSRGYDPDKPTGRKSAKGLPVAYPFLLRSQVFIPAVVPEVRPQRPFRMYFRTYHLGLHPESGTPRLHVKCEVLDALGNISALARLSLLEGPSLLPPDSHEFLFEAQIDRLPAGPCSLKVTCLDLVKDRSASAVIPLVVED